MSFKHILFFFLIILLTNCQNNKNTFTPNADKDNGGLFLPDGFGALVVVDSVGASRHLAVNSNGDIYIKLSTPKGRKGNVALRDTNNDGKADIVKRFGNYPNDGRFATEMRIHKGYLYFSSELVVYRQKLTPGKLIPEGKPQVLVRDPFPIRWHNAKSLAFDNKGGMYVTFSAPTNACENGIMKGPDNIDIVKGENPCSQLKILAGVWRFYEDRPNQSLKSGKRYATGLRSLVGITWNDNDNSLYAVNHGRDYLYNHAPQFYSEWRNAILPSEEFIRIKEGENYGWPYTYYDHFKHKRMLAPEYGGDGETEAKGYADPIMGLPAHWAPNDLLFYKGNQFPERYKKGAFIAFHGSFNRNPYPQAGYVVVFVPFKNGKPIGTYEIFADGFIGKDTISRMSESKYRPMGLAEGPDGSLYISDSKKGKIWRVIFKGNKTTFGKVQLAKMEKRKEKPHLKIPDEKRDILTIKKE
ncbi:MAG: PQQ-dependent sugar dehydrogenase [Flavobacteriaceae bacterium]